MRNAFFVFVLSVSVVGCGKPIGDGYGVGSDNHVELPLSSLLTNDPLNIFAWHIQNRGQYSYSTNHATYGIDVNMLASIAEGLDGTGMRICVSDSGVESTHEDLAGNYLTGASTDYSGTPWGTSPEPLAIGDNHGTAVAGLIVALAGNGKGSRGIASNAKWASKNLLSDAANQTSTAIGDQADGDFDIFNYSWGSSNLDTYLEMEPLFEAQMLDGVTNGRAGRGSIYVKAAGNEYDFRLSSTVTRHGFATLDGYNNTPYTVIVAAVNAAGVKAGYSSPGSNVWVTAPSGQSGYPQMITTDRDSCTRGYANVAEAGYVPTFNLVTSVLNPNCRYDISFNGTSAASPVIAGAVAVILDANPTLGWRDLKHILAKTSRRIDAQTASYANRYVASPTGHVWQRGWITNAAGYGFHNHFGFGLIDVDAAVAMAKNYNVNLGTLNVSAGGGVWDYRRTGLNVSIPDNSAVGASDSMAVATNWIIEGVQVRILASHPDISELGIELTSPSGTKSIIINTNNTMIGLANYLGEIFLTNAFYGESSAGNWQIKVVDGKSGNSGALTRWELRLFGRNP